MGIAEMIRLREDERLAIEESQQRAAQANTPLKLSELASRLGVRVVASTLPPGVSGELRPAPRGGFVISINRHDSPRRQRFTVAHELAHYLLHRDQIGSGIKDDVLYRSGLSDSREAEANRLAAQILMPIVQVGEKLKAYGGIATEAVVSNLAADFGVSEAAMRIRLGLE
jgi:Zn-dependent peptidase ImmA (M78 family)